MENSKIERKLQFLTIYAVVSSLFIAFMLAQTVIVPDNSKLLSELTSSDSLHVPYLTAERVDIVEPDGQLAIALSN